MSRNDTPMNESDETLSEEELMLLSADAKVLDSVDIDSMKMKSLRSKVMAQVDMQTELLTIRANSGDWLDVSSKIRKKILHVDEGSGIETYLLKIEAGATDAPHVHSSDEHCIVLEGDVTFGDVHLNAGDYHLAPKGSRHDEAHSVNGALLYIQTGIESTVPV